MYIVLWLNAPHKYGPLPMLDWSISLRAFNVPSQNVFPVFKIHHIRIAWQNLNCSPRSTAALYLIWYFATKFFMAPLQFFFSDFFSLPNNPNLRGHPFRIAVPIARNNIRKHFFSVRVIPIWKSLPLNLVTSPTEEIFKRRILKRNLVNHLTLPSFFLSDINWFTFNQCDFLYIDWFCFVICFVYVLYVFMILIAFICYFFILIVYWSKHTYMISHSTTNMKIQMKEININWRSA